MSINLNDNINVSAPLPIDSRYGNGSSLPFTAYANTTAANTATAGKRYIGLTVLIGTPPVEYWYANGINDNDLVPKFYNVADNSGSGSINYTFLDANVFSTFNISKNAPFMESGDIPITIGSPGSKSRVLAFRSTAAIWTNNYTSFAYEAQTRYLADHPWVTIPPNDSHNFQVYDTIVTTNRSGTLLARYYDERYLSKYWQETYNNKKTLTAGKTYNLAYYNAGDNFSGMVVTTTSGTINTSGWTFIYTSGTPTTWTNGSILIDTDNNRLSGSTQLLYGKVYTLTTLAGGDSFTGIGTTYPGTTGSPTSPPWTFTSNGTQPATWTNGSIIEGDFPYIPKDQKTSLLTAEVATSGIFTGKGVLNAVTNSFNCYGMFDQSEATRGTVLASMTTTQRTANIPTPKKGEMIFNTTSNTLNYYNGATWVSV